MFFVVFELLNLNLYLTFKNVYPVRKVLKSAYEVVKYLVIKYLVNYYC